MMIKPRTFKKRGMEERGKPLEEAATTNYYKEHRRTMRERTFAFMKKSAHDEMREIELYSLYDNGFGYFNPWRTDDMHGVNNDVALITAELED
jgi:hypothetical protein